MMNKIHERIRTNKCLRIERRRKRYIKSRNIRRSLRKRNKGFGHIKSSYDNRFRITFTKIKLPQDFRLLSSNMTNVLKTIHEFECATRNNIRGRQRIDIDLSCVLQLDVAALGMLLAAINSKQHVYIRGNYPLDRDCRDFFIESGFLDHMNTLQGRKPEKRNKNNLMIERGFDKTSNKRIGEEVRRAVKYLTGEDKTYRPVFSILQEMCANSIEHANSKNHEKNWLVGIYYESNKVIFTVTDIGQGILSTLKKKAEQIFRDTLIARGPVGTLVGAFDKKYQSSTFDENRNKGLPRIKDANSFDYIDSLKVITNNVFLDFDDNTQNAILKTQFRGTFYYWELTQNAIEKWRNRNIQ